MEIDYTTIRRDGRQSGYEARVAKTFQPNPYLPGTSTFDHWADGYDLGVLDADTLMVSNDNHSDHSDQLWSM